MRFGLPGEAESMPPPEGRDANWGGGFSSAVQGGMWLLQTPQRQMMGRHGRRES